MERLHAPLKIGGVTTDPTTLFLVALTVVVVGMLVAGVRREIATVAIAMGVIGAMLAA